MLQLDPDQLIKPLDVLQCPFFTYSLPQSSPADTCIQVDSDQETPEVSQQSSFYPTAGPEKTLCSVENTAASRAAGPEENTGDVQLEASA